MMYKVPLRISIRQDMFKSNRILYTCIMIPYASVNVSVYSMYTVCTYDAYKVGIRLLTPQYISGSLFYISQYTSPYM